MSKPVKVLHIVNRMNKGGIQSFLMNYYRNMDRSAIQFDFVVQANKGSFYDNEITELGGKLYNLPQMSVTDVRAFSRELSTLLRESSEYKIIHSHLNWLNVIPLKIAKKHNVPVRISHSHGSYPSRNLFKAMQRLVFQKVVDFYATDLWACSELAGRWLYGEDFLDNPKSKVIHNAIDVDKFKFNPEIRKRLRVAHNLDPETKVLINVGRLSDGKNHSFLLDVFKEYQLLNPNSVLLIAGDGPLRSQIEEKAQTLKIADKTIFLGMIDNVNEYLSASDIMVFPSESEGLSLVLIEAQTNGLEILVSDEGISKETDVTGRLKFLKLSENASTWAQNICDLSNIDRQNSVDVVREAGYDIKQAARALQHHYLDLIKSNYPTFYTDRRTKRGLSRFV